MSVDITIIIIIQNNKYIVGQLSINISMLCGVLQGHPVLRYLIYTAYQSRCGLHSDIVNARTIIGNKWVASNEIARAFEQGVI